LEARTILARKALENGETYMKLRRYAAARFYFRVVIDDYPETDVVPEALYRTARAFDKEGNPERAGEIMEELRRRFPDSTWTARLGSELGRRTEKKEVGS
jgi:TolA-binding protein